MGESIGCVALHNTLSRPILLTSQTKSDYTQPMETHLNISQAKATFSAVVERAAAGESIIITKMGKPVAKVSAIEPTQKKPLWGAMAGHDFKIADDFDELPDEIARAFGMID